MSEWYEPKADDSDQRNHNRNRGRTMTDKQSFENQVKSCMEKAYTRPKYSAVIDASRAIRIAKQADQAIAERDEKLERLSGIIDEIERIIGQDTDSASNALHNILMTIKHGVPPKC